MMYGSLKFSALLVLCCGCLSAAAAQPGGPSLVDLRTEYRTDPVGIDAVAPRLSWRIEAERRDTRQTGYRIQVAESAAALRQGEGIWDTGRVRSDRSIQIEYGGPDLQSGKRYSWRVRVWDNYGRDSGWSEVATWETGLLDAGDWQAEWIEPAIEEDLSDSPPAPMLRTEFDLDGEIRRARAYVTAHGVYEMEVNGKRVGDQVLSPGWTSYDTRLQYQTYDITDLLQPGGNAVGVFLGDGWYRGYIGFNDQRNYYGENLALLARIVVEYSDGRTEVFRTDENWKSTTGPILRSDFYNGEVYDARLEKEGWSQPGYDDGNWSGVRTVDHGKEHLIAQEAPPVRKIQKLEPREILVTPEGDTVVDMGQNMVGWLRLRVEGEAGTEITLRHAEVLDRDGNFYRENIRAARQTNTYILKGNGEEIWEPRFTFQGFRYVAVDGYPGELTIDDLTGIVLHSDLAPTGHFECSHPLINQLQHNIVWGQKGNFLDIPTDCPQRDERLGWTGDIQVFAATANINMNSAAFLTKWLGDLEADQRDNGSVPHVVPDVLGAGWDGAAGWGDAAVIVPWEVYRAYGDESLLERQYVSMKAWVDYMENRAAGTEETYLWNGDFTFGDWLSYNTTESDYPGAYTEKDLIATAFFARSTDLLSRTARILGNEADAERYSELFEKVRTAFQKEYLTPRGRVMSNTQTAYLLALKFGLLPEDRVPDAVENLVENVERHGHLTTGFLGTPHLNPVLSEYGRSDLAFRLLVRTDYPSWLYPVTMGATTIWERWDGIKPDGTFQNPGMNSFNHYAYGAIGEWLYKEVAGIRAAKPGYRRIEIEPLVGGGLTHARGFLDSPYGRIESSWKVDGNSFVLEVEVPANTRASVVLPYAAGRDITESGDGLTDAEGVVLGDDQGADVVLELGSGRYRFSYSAADALLPSGDAAGEEAGKEFRIEDKLGTLVADQDAREVLLRHAPKLMDSPWLSQVLGFDLRYALAALPGDFSIPSELIETIGEELEALN